MKNKGYLENEIKDLKQLERNIDADIERTKERLVINKMYCGLNFIVRTARKFAQKINK